MSISRKITLAFAIVLACCVQESFAQILINVKPARPAYSKAKSPSTSHVWIGDDWLVKDTSYVWNGDRWAEPPQKNAIWIPGRWKHKKEGYIWVPGKWR